jgi:hypothetical protein
MINELIQEKTLRVKTICLDNENWKSVHEFLNGSAPSEVQVRESEEHQSVHHTYMDMVIPFGSYIILVAPYTYIVLSKEEYDEATIV